MPTADEKRIWREQAEASLRAKKEAELAEIQRQQLQNELRAQATAAERKEEDRRMALGTWIANGGSQATFDENWEKLYEDLIYKRTLQAMAGGDPGGGRAYIARRFRV